jgi:SAM-dependent methyltransferase
MKWEKYYSKPVSPRHYMSDVSNHRPFLFEIIRSQSRGGRLLEVGSGSGVLSIFLSRRGHEVISIDNNEGVLAVARANNIALNGTCTFIKADAHSLPFRDNFFQTCFSQGFFEHFSNHDIGKLLAEQLRVTRVVIFSVPTFWYPQREFGDERLMKQEGWLRILRGLKVNKAIYYRYARPLAPAFREAARPFEARPLEIYFRITGE